MDKIDISFKLFNGVSAKVVNWYKIKKKCGTEIMLKFCSGWMNVRQNRSGAMIISLNFPNNSFNFINLFTMFCFKKIAIRKEGTCENYLQSILFFMILLKIRINALLPELKISLK